MEIVKIGKADFDERLLFKCKICDCEFICSKKDIEIRTDSFSEYYLIRCPFCEENQFFYDGDTLKDANKRMIDYNYGKNIIFR